MSRRADAGRSTRTRACAYAARAPGTGGTVTATGAAATKRESLA